MPQPKHRLVVIGDSVSQGFMSGAVHRVEVSYPALVAAALGVRDSFAVAEFKGQYAMPLNLEWIVRQLSHHYGQSIRWWKYPCMLLRLRAIMDKIEDYWERGEGSRPSAEDRVHHNLSVWGFCVRDAYTVTDAVCRAAIEEPPRDDWIRQVPQQAMYRTARRVLNPSFSPAAAGRHQIAAARELAGLGGIENLVVHLGANNALGALTALRIRESEPGDLERLPHECTWNLFRPEHFDKHYAELAAEVEKIGAERVFPATIPHLTIPPVTRGVSPGGTLEDGYFEFYTRPWVWDNEFDPARHAHLTRDDARKIDACIDQHNETIRRTAAAKGWHVLEACRMTDRLAYRRSGGKPAYEFPPGLVDALRRHVHVAYLVDDQGRVRLDTRFLMGDRAHPDRLAKGGLVSLDGIHPTTIGYALAADLLVRTMHEAGVEFPRGPSIDWNRVVRADRLVGSPPHLLVNLQSCLKLLDTRGLLNRVLESFDRAG